MGAMMGGITGASRTYLSNKSTSILFFTLYRGKSLIFMITLQNEVVIFNLPS